jgi:hypothetical protein
MLKRRGSGLVSHRGTRIANFGPGSSGARATMSSSGSSHGSSQAVRRIRVRVEQARFRTTVPVAPPTLLDAKEYTAGELVGPYRAAVDRRVRPAVAETDTLDGRAAGKSPDLPQKDTRPHALAYKRVRAATAQATAQQGLEPRSVGFKGK